MKFQKSQILRRTLALACAACALTDVRAADYPKYRITDLGAPSTAWFIVGNGGRPLDASGEVVGMLNDHLMLWAGGGKAPIDIGSLPGGTGVRGTASGISANGMVTGSAQFGGSGTNPHAFIWKHDGTVIKDLGWIGSVDSSDGAAVNSLGQVAGNSDSRAFIWKNDGGPMHDLGNLGGTSTSASAINESGQITGSSATRGTRVPHAFLWKNDGTPMVDLGPRAGKASYGLSINASGQVSGYAWAGVANNSPYYHAYVWRNDGMPPVDLGKAGGTHTSSGQKINDAGQVMGFAWSAAANVYRAFTWRSNGTAVDLGTLGGTRVEAYDINRTGWVVGISTTSPANDSYYNAFLWIDNGQGMKKLNDLIDPADPLKQYIDVTGAFAINDAGDIAVSGVDSRDGGAHEYVLHGSNLTLDPTVLTFGNQAVGSGSAPKVIGVHNRTDAVVPINSIKLTGIGAGQFSFTSLCGSSVVANGNCTITVTFKPTAAGAKSAKLSVNGGGNGLRVVNLTGKGT